MGDTAHVLGPGQQQGLAGVEPDRARVEDAVDHVRPLIGGQDGVAAAAFEQIVPSSFAWIVHVCGSLSLQENEPETVERALSAVGLKERKGPVEDILWR